MTDLCLATTNRLVPLEGRFLCSNYSFTKVPISLFISSKYSAYGLKVWLWKSNKAAVAGLGVISFKSQLKNQTIARVHIGLVSRI